MNDFTLRRKRNLSSNAEEVDPKGELVSDKGDAVVYRSSKEPNEGEAQTPQEEKTEAKDTDQKQNNIAETAKPISSRSSRAYEQRVSSKSNSNILGNLLLFLLLMGNLALIGIQARLSEAIKGQTEERNSSFNSFKEGFQNGLSEINDSLREIKNEVKNLAQDYSDLYHWKSESAVTSPKKTTIVKPQKNRLSSKFAHQKRQKSSSRIKQSNKFNKNPLSKAPGADQQYDATSKQPSNLASQAGQTTNTSNSSHDSANSASKRSAVTNKQKNLLSEVPLSEETNEASNTKKEMQNNHSKMPIGCHGAKKRNTNKRIIGKADQQH